MSEEVKTAEEQQKNDEITPRNDEIVEVSWESLQPIFQIKLAAGALEENLANLLVQHEKNKANLLDKLSELESDLYSSAYSLRNSLDISPDLIYELKLPQKEGEKGYFIRKDQ